MKEPYNDTSNPNVIITEPAPGNFVILGHHPQSRFVEGEGYIVPSQSSEIPQEVPTSALLWILNQRGVNVGAQVEAVKGGATPVFEATFQQRVINEKADLEERAKKLSDFIGNNPLFETLSKDEQERLRVQNDIMWQYYEILEARISAFSQTKEPSKESLSEPAGSTLALPTRVVELIKASDSAIRLSAAAVTLGVPAGLISDAAGIDFEVASGGWLKLIEKGEAQ